MPLLFFCIFLLPALTNKALAQGGDASKSSSPARPGVGRKSRDSSVKPAKPSRNKNTPLIERPDPTIQSFVGTWHFKNCIGIFKYVNGSKVGAYISGETIDGVRVPSFDTLDIKANGIVAGHFSEKIKEYWAHHDDPVMGKYRSALDFSDGRIWSTTDSVIIQSQKDGGFFGELMVENGTLVLYDHDNKDAGKCYYSK